MTIVEQEESLDFTDLSLLADFWLAEGQSIPADLNTDGRVDFRDFALLGSDWLRQTSRH